MRCKLLFLTLLIISLFTLVGCSNLLPKDETTTTDVTTNETTTSPTEIAEETKQEETVQPSEKATKEPETTAKATAKANTSTTNNNTSSNTKTTNTKVFNDFLNTQEYVVPTTGTYTFSCKPSDGKTTWDIYVLDEKFEDALRYLTNAYKPVLTATSKAQTYKLQKGQYVYCVCSQNSFTFEGDKNTFKCPLTIALN